MALIHANAMQMVEYVPVRQFVFVRNFKQIEMKDQPKMYRHKKTNLVVKEYDSEYYIEKEGSMVKNYIPKEIVEDSNDWEPFLIKGKWYVIGGSLIGRYKKTVSNQAVFEECFKEPFDNLIQFNNIKRLANRNEIENHLKKLIKAKYKIGDTVSSAYDKRIVRRIAGLDDMNLAYNEINGFTKVTLYEPTVCIYNNGNWAEIVERAKEKPENPLHFHGIKLENVFKTPDHIFKEGWLNSMVNNPYDFPIVGCDPCNDDLVMSTCYAVNAINLLSKEEALKRWEESVYKFSLENQLKELRKKYPNDSDFGKVASRLIN